MLSLHFALLQSLGQKIVSVIEGGCLDFLYSPAVQILLTLLLFFTVRLIYLISKNHDARILSKQAKDRTIKTMIIIGSGGHTTEMLRLMKEMNPNFYYPRMYVIAASDTSSEVKIHKTEKQLSLKASKRHLKYLIYKVPRSRHVGQSYITSIFSTTFSFIRSVPMMLSHRPELVLCNGPGTCIPICFFAFFMRLMFLTNTMIIFIESICRVESLSLSGKLLYYIADVLLVQWPDLESKYSRASYIGRL